MEIAFKAVYYLFLFKNQSNHVKIRDDIYKNILLHKEDFYTYFEEDENSNIYIFHKYIYIIFNKI
jgi:hypothetical protein